LISKENFSRMNEKSSNMILKVNVEEKGKNEKVKLSLVQKRKKCVKLAGGTFLRNEEK
jgi:hypothetical protein